MYLVSCILYLALSACGFHLRGSLNDAVRLPPTYLAGNAGPLEREVRHYLAVGKAQVVEDQGDAQLILTLAGEDVQRRVLSVGASGKVEEYEVNYAATYSAVAADGRVIVAPETLTRSRSYTFDQSQVLAKDQEQVRLVQDMRRETVRRMMQRLQAKLGRLQ